MAPDALEWLHASVEALTAPRVTTTARPLWTRSRNRKVDLHRVRHAPLLAELADAATPGHASQDGRGGRSVPGSRPAAWVDAVDALQFIRESVGAWCVWLAVPPRGGLAGDIRGLLGTAAGLRDDAVVAQLAADAHQWVGMAETLTGWSTPPFAPHVACPRCERLGGLRIRIDLRQGTCLHCRACWRTDDGGFGILAAHIRQATEGETA